MGTWKAGRAVLATHKLSKGKTITYQFIGTVAAKGELATDVVQGILITKTGFDDIDKIMKIEDLTPYERTQKVKEVINGLGMTWGMVSVSLHESAAERSSLEAGGFNSDEIYKNLHTLDDPLLPPLDTTKAHGVITHTKEGKAKITARKVQPPIVDEPVRSGSTKAAQRSARKRRRKEKRNKGKARPPRNRGMLPKHHRALLQFVKGTRTREKLIIYLIDSNPRAVHWMNTPSITIGGIRYRPKPKPAPVKGKTLKGDTEIAGLASLNPSDPKLNKHLEKVHLTYDQVIADLEKKGYKVLGPEHEFLVVHPKRKEVFYSDFDAHGMYWASGPRKGKEAYTQDLKNELNEAIDKKRDLFQHPTRDRWHERNNPETAGFNVGPTAPVTAITPEGAFPIRDVAELKASYEEHGIDFDGIWHDPEKS